MYKITDAQACNVTFLVNRLKSPSSRPLRTGRTATSHLHRRKTKREEKEVVDVPLF